MVDINREFLKLQFGFKGRMKIYRKLGKFLSNGYAMAPALDEMYGFAIEGGRSTKIEAMVLNDARRGVANGLGLAYGLKDWIPNGERLIIEGGEQSGKLDIALDKAVQITQAARTIKGTLVGGLFYPFLLIALTIGFMIMFGTNVIPAFEEILPREQWTGLAGQMSFLADFIQTWLAPSIIAVMATVIVVSYSLPRWVKGLRVKADKIVPYSIYRTIQGAGFMMTLAGMLQSGIPLERSLEILSTNAAPWYRERIERTRHLINSGNDLGPALHMTGYQFPDRDSINELRAYSKLSNVEDALEHLAKTWLEETVEKIKVQTGIMRNIAFLFLGGVFGWITFGMVAVQQQISAAVQ